MKLQSLLFLCMIISFDCNASSDERNQGVISDLPSISFSRPSKKQRQNSSLVVEKSIQDFLKKQFGNEGSLNISRKAQAEKYKVRSCAEQSRREHEAKVEQAKNKVIHASIDSYGDAFNEFREVIKDKSYVEKKQATLTSFWWCCYSNATVINPEQQ